MSWKFALPEIPTYTCMHVCVITKALLEKITVSNTLCACGVAVGNKLLSVVWLYSGIKMTDCW